MFLFNPAVTSDWESVQAELTRLMERVGARVIASAKWDERRLAFEVEGCRRGIYALTYFEAESPKIIDLERDVQLSESALRCLITRAEHLTEEEMAEAVERAASQPPPDDDRDRGRYGDRNAASRVSASADKPAKPAEVAKPAEADGEAKSAGEGLPKVVADKQGAAGLETAEAAETTETAEAVETADADKPEE